MRVMLNCNASLIFIIFIAILRSWMNDGRRKVVLAVYKRVETVKERVVIPRENIIVRKKYRGVKIVKALRAWRERAKYLNDNWINKKRKVRENEIKTWSDLSKDVRNFIKEHLILRYI